MEVSQRQLHLKCCSWTCATTPGPSRHGGHNKVSISRFSYLPLEDFRLQAERSSAVVALQLHRIVRGERRLSIRGWLQGGILRAKARNDAVVNGQLL